MDGGKSSMKFFKSRNCGRVAVFQKYLLTAVVIEIGQCECTSVFQKVQADRTRNVGKRTVADCWRKKYFVRSRSRCHRHESIH